MLLEKRQNTYLFEPFHPTAVCCHEVRMIATIKLLTNNIEILLLRSVICSSLHKQILSESLVSLWLDGWHVLVWKNENYTLNYCTNIVHGQMWTNKPPCQTKNKKYWKYLNCSTHRFKRFFLGVSTNSGTSDSESLPLPAIERSLKDSLLLFSMVILTWNFKIDSAKWFY